MKLIVSIICLVCLKFALSSLVKDPKDCDEDDCYCKERSVVRRLSKETERREFLMSQKNFDEDKYKIECDKIGVQLRNKWGTLAKETECEAIKIFIKKRLVLWDFVCSFDHGFRQEFEGEFFEKFEECDKLFFELCGKDGVDYCDPEPIKEAQRCVEKEMKDKCANSGLFARAVKKNFKFLKETNRCGDKNPAALNQFKKRKRIAAVVA